MQKTIFLMKLCKPVCFIVNITLPPRTRASKYSHHFVAHFTVWYPDDAKALRVIFEALKHLPWPPQLYVGHCSLAVVSRYHSWYDGYVILPVPSKFCINWLNSPYIDKYRFSQKRWNVFLRTGKHVFTIHFGYSQYLPAFPTSENVLRSCSSI